MRSVYFLILFALFFISCGKEKYVEINYNLEKPVILNLFTQNHYSTMDGDLERVGTITATYFKVKYSQNGDTLVLERDFVSDASKGYLKKSYPGELALRIPKMILTAKERQIYDIKGYETFDSVMKKVTIPERWKKQIFDFSNTIDFKREEKRRWEITHLLNGKIPAEGDITALLNSQGKLPSYIDSVVTKGFREVNGNKCFYYIVYLQERELFPYFIWEQHVYSVASGAQFKSYMPKEAKYITRYEVSLVPETGVPCLEVEYKNGINGMQHPESKDSTSFRSLLFYERFYTSD